MADGCPVTHMGKKQNEGAGHGDHMLSELGQKRAGIEGPDEKKAGAQDPCQNRNEQMVTTKTLHKRDATHAEQEKREHEVKAAVIERLGQ